MQSPASQLEQDIICQGHTVSRKLCLSFAYRYRRLSQPEQGLTLQMKNLSFTALRFEEWKHCVGSNYSAPALGNFNIPDSPAHQLDASLTQLSIE